MANKAPITRIADHLERDAQETALDLTRDADELLNKTRKSLARSARQLQRASKALTSEAKRNGREFGKRSVREVRDHPIAATAIALSAVALAGVLFARRAH